ncbi:MAG: CDP-alcohol phosphatidyltransferase family protein [Candidatus Zapsychrus exili]|nr:CDP-alcohol phosphatidyltransferase family protein [Candidatus Zapsychrus exili]
MGGGLVSLNFANKITIARIIAVPIFIGTVLYYSKQNDFLRFVSLGVFLFAVISDVFDGYIARTRNQKTKAGAILDPLADKFLLISAFVCLFYKGNFWADVIRFPGWVVIAVISRDIILILGAMILYVVNGRLEVEPTIWGKATTFVEILAIISILLQWSFSFVVWYVMLFFIVISGIDYIRKGIKLINAGGRL